MKLRNYVLLMSLCVTSKGNVSELGGSRRLRKVLIFILTHWLIFQNVFVSSRSCLDRKILLQIVKVESLSNFRLLTLQLFLLSLELCNFRVVSFNRALRMVISLFESN